MFKKITPQKKKKKKIFKNLIKFNKNQKKKIKKKYYL